MKTLLSSAALAAVLSTAAFAEPEAYVLDASHSQVVFSWSHAGYSTTYGMFSGFEGELMFDAENPEASSVSVQIPVASMFTGWEARDAHLLGDDFFAHEEGDLITFESTGIEVTGETTGLITGILTVAGNSAEVVLDATFNGAGPSIDPSLNGAQVAGFSATTTLSRTEFGLGAFTPFVGDEVEVELSIEAVREEDLQG